MSVNADYPPEQPEKAPKDEFLTRKQFEQAFSEIKTHNHQPTKSMAKGDLILKGDLAFGAQMKTFKNNIGPVAASLGLTPVQVAQQAADSDYYNYVHDCQNLVLNHSKAWTALKQLTRAGKVAGEFNGLGALVLPAAVPPVAPGVERRFRTLVRQCKASVNYSPAMGEGLGIEAAHHTPPDWQALQPVIRVRVTGNRVRVEWGWQGHRVFLDQCEIQVDRGDGNGFVLLTYATVPGYMDKTPFPDAPVKWLYRAIYRVADAQVGQWSSVTGVTVPP